MAETTQLEWDHARDSKAKERTSSQERVTTFSGKVQRRTALTTCIHVHATDY